MFFQGNWAYHMIKKINPDIDLLFMPFPAYHENQAKVVVKIECDHFVFPEYKLGNIYSQTLVEMMHSERQHNFGTMKYQSLPTQCKECDFLFACNGECPKNRFSRTADGETGLNYLCKGYYQYFQHVAPYMDFMKNELMNQRPPANIMKALKDGSLKI